MKPVYKGGECWRACLASILEVDLDSIPKSLDNEMGWFFEIKEWLKTKGLNIIYIGNMDDALQYDFINSNYPYIGIGKTECNKVHAVVLKGNKIIHNPNPDNVSIKNIMSICIITPLEHPVLR